MVEMSSLAISSPDCQHLHSHQYREIIINKAQHYCQGFSNLWHTIKDNRQMLSFNLSTFSSSLEWVAHSHSCFVNQWDGKHFLPVSLEMNLSCSAVRKAVTWCTCCSCARVSPLWCVSLLCCTNRSAMCFSLASFYVNLYLLCLCFVDWRDDTTLKAYRICKRATIKGSSLTRWLGVTSEATGPLHLRFPVGGEFFFCVKCSGRLETFQ